MKNIKISAETYDNLQGIRRENETLTEALERMALALHESGVVSTSPDNKENDPWKRGPL